MSTNYYHIWSSTNNNWFTIIISQYENLFHHIYAFPGRQGRRKSVLICSHSVSLVLINVGQLIFSMSKTKLSSKPLDKIHDQLKSIGSQSAMTKFGLYLLPQNHLKCPFFFKPHAKIPNGLEDKASL